MNKVQMLERAGQWNRYTNESRSHWAGFRLELRYPGAKVLALEKCLFCGCNSLYIFSWHGKLRLWCAVCADSLVEFVMKGGDRDVDDDGLRSPEKRRQEGQEG